MKRIRIEIDPKFDAGGDATRHESRMIVTARDGRRVERHARYRKGSPQNPMSAEERHAKFHRLASPILPSTTVENIFAKVESLERSDDIIALVRLLCTADDAHRKARRKDLRSREDAGPGRAG